MEKEQANHGDFVLPSSERFSSRTFLYVISPVLRDFSLEFKSQFKFRSYAAICDVTGKSSDPIDRQHNDKCVRSIDLRRVSDGGFLG